MFVIHPLNGPFCTVADSAAGEAGSCSFSITGGDGTVVGETFYVHGETERLPFDGWFGGGSLICC